MTPQPEDPILASEHEIEFAVRRIVDFVYHEAAKAGSHEAESLILARVAAKLVDSWVCESQAGVTRAALLHPQRR